MGADTSFRIVDGNHGLRKLDPRDLEFGRSRRWLDRWLVDRWLGHGGQREWRNREWRNRERRNREWRNRERRNREWNCLGR